MFNRKPDEQDAARARATGGRERDEAGHAATREIQTASGATLTVPVSAPPAPNYRATPGDVNVTVPSRSARGGSLLDSHDAETLIGERTTFEGTLKAEGAIRVLGAVEGELLSKGIVQVEEKARVRGKITAGQVLIAGHVEGEIHCEGRLEIRASGHVTGEIHAGTLAIQEGAHFDGSSHMGEDGAPRPPADGAR